VLSIDISILAQHVVAEYYGILLWNGMTNSSIHQSPLLSLGKTPSRMCCFVIATNVVSQNINIHVEHCISLHTL